jgi:succinate dehydrogenase / fumarate reductase cytochrome b subunit
VQDRYAYYPGCLASLSQKELDSSTRAIARKLEVELVDMPSVTCCGAGDIHEAKPDYYLHLSARILGQAERTGVEVLLTICNVCTLNLRQANKRLQEDAQELARINDNLRQVGAATYSGGVEVRHLLWEVAHGEGYERFKQVAVRSLEGLRVAPFYGCQILRPAKMLGFEDPDRPQSMERLIEACGAEPIDYPAKVKCCGFPIILAREDVALGELIQPLHEATEAGADVMVTPCPLCHLSLDAWQKKASRKAGEAYSLPVLHLAQLLGAAAGIDEDELKFKRHVVRLSDDVKYKLKLPSVHRTPTPAGD